MSKGRLTLVVIIASYWEPLLIIGDWSIPDRGGVYRHFAAFGGGYLTRILMRFV